jgi:hypothetical protein
VESILLEAPFANELYIVERKKVDSPKWLGTVIIREPRVATLTLLADERRERKGRRRRKRKPIENQFGPIGCYPVGGAIRIDDTAQHPWIYMCECVFPFAFLSLRL